MRIKSLLHLSLFFVLVVSSVSLSGCSTDEDNEADKTNVDSTNVASTNPHERIIGSWKLIKAIPESDNCLGYDYFCFYPDGTFKCNHVLESKEYQGKYEIIVNDYSESVFTTDNSSLQTNYHLQLHLGENLILLIFVIKDDIMHLYIPYAYLHNAYKFKHVEVP